MMMMNSVHFLRRVGSLAVLAIVCNFAERADAQNRSAVEAYQQRYREYKESRHTVIPAGIVSDFATREIVGTLVPGPNSIELKLDHPSARLSLPVEISPRLHTSAFATRHGAGGTNVGADPSEEPNIYALESMAKVATEDHVTVAEAITSFPLKLKVRLEGDRTVVSDVQLEAVDAWKERRKRLGPTMATKDVDRAIERVEAEFDRLKQLPKSAAAEESLQESLLMAESALVTAYREGIGSLDEKEAVCEQFGELRRTRLKARFGREDNYRPEIYDLIYQNSRSICGIVRKGDSRPFGTGVMIGDDLILTCLHNFTLSGLDPQQCEAWFNYEAKAGAFESPDIFPLGSFVCLGKPIGPLSVPLDFALLRLLPRADGTHIQSLEQAGKLKYPLPTLDDRPLVRDDAVYVVGHPAGSMRMVHDNAFVLFPFRTNQLGFDTLRMIVCAETKESPDRGNELRQFLESFIPRDPRPGESSRQFEQYSLRWDGMPVFAADCDTSRGNSGSPVFDRQTNGLVGLLHAGEQDLAESHTAGWRRHEAIIPIELIVDQVNAQMSDWVSDFGVSLR
jgi:V8-like Glu-specific endopeptidase